MGSLKNLPVELLLMIIDKIQRQDLIALRATSRRFSFLVTPTHIFTTIFIGKKLERGSMGYLQKILENSEVRRSVKELAFDINALRINLKHSRGRVISQVKKISALVASYNDLVIEKIRINNSINDIELCFDQLQGAGINSARNIWITAASCLPCGSSFRYRGDRNNQIEKLLPGVQALAIHLPNPDHSPLPAFTSLSGLSNLQVCHLINPSKDPTETLSNFAMLSWNENLMMSIRRLHLTCYTIRPVDFLELLKYMPQLEEAILIDIILCGSFESRSNMTQRSMWLDLARDFDETFRDDDKRLLIGVTEGSVCQGSDVDYSGFNKSVRKLSRDEVLDMMNCVDFER